MYILIIGLRNILKNPRRSLFTAIAIGAGFTSINVFSGYIHNVYAGLADQAVRGEGLAHLTIARSGYFENASLNPERYLIAAGELANIGGMLDADPHVEVWTPRLSVSGMVSNGRVSTVFIAEGQDPAKEATIRGSFRPDRGGALDPRLESGIAVSSDLARLLNLKGGGQAVLFTTTAEGQANALDVDVHTIYNTGITATNDKSLLLPLRFAQRLFDTTGADRIRVLLKEPGDVEAARERLKASLAAQGFRVDIRTWRELSGFYQQVKNLFDIIFVFIFGIVLVVVVMSIINTMTMSVMERTREIGTLRALGMKRWHIIRLFSAEAMSLACIGGAAGLIVTIAIAQLVNMTGIQYVPPNTSDRVPLLVDLVMGRIALTFLFLVALATVSACLPSLRAARMQIVDALGHV